MEKKLSLLLVDDEAIVGNRLKPALVRNGYDVEAFEDSTEAMKRIDEKEFDIVVTDILMPGVDGISVLNYIRKSQRSNTPVIGISGTPWLLKMKTST